MSTKGNENAIKSAHRGGIKCAVLKQIRSLPTHCKVDSYFFNLPTIYGKIMQRTALPITLSLLEITFIFHFFFLKEM